jgi:UDP-N-acetylglucosamine 2-epimerase
MSFAHNPYGDGRAVTRILEVLGAEHATADAAAVG